MSMGSCTSDLKGSFMSALADHVVHHGPPPTYDKAWVQHLLRAWPYCGMAGIGCGACMRCQSRAVSVAEIQNCEQGSRQVNMNDSYMKWLNPPNHCP